MTFSGNTRAQADPAGDSVPGRRSSSGPERTQAAALRVAYVIADDRGSCRDATGPALELLGIDIGTLLLLRVGDLTKPDSPDSLTRQLVAGCDDIERWLVGTCELLRPDGAAVRVRFATLRMKSGELAVRFDRPEDVTAGRQGPRAVLQAWREQELELAQTPAGSREHRIAQLEARWLAAEYQQLAIARAESVDVDR
jgi:hypothetical protein